MPPSRQRPQATLKVVLLLESSRASGRDLLRGVARYAHHHGPWSFYWEPAGLERAWPMLKSWTRMASSCGTWKRWKKCWPQASQRWS
ncbi:MAG: hypothetical protein KJ072_09170 [Verrucomicrobia bacterium]|nr:hypothetical protein [Verrucomicrobiota bacterium]